MYNIKLTDYVPEPKPATSKYLVCAHYYAAWKKKCALLHEGFDDLHDYPERTPLAGYYDEGDPTYADWEIKWALEHGINCFIHCWYRYRDNVGKPIKVENLRCAHGLHDGFFNAKYDKMMKFALMFECSPKWGTTNEKDLVENLLPFWFETYFKRGNYLIIDNKPVLFVFAFRELRDAFGSAENTRCALDICREYARKEGFDGMIIAAESKRYHKEFMEEVVECGFDFAFSYNWWGGFAGPDAKEEEEFITAQYNTFKGNIEMNPKGYITTASCFWDSEPRMSQHWRDLGYDYSPNPTWYIYPDGFRKVLRNCIELNDNLPDDNPGKNIIMIDNWNEWDEGHYIAPSHKFGFGYLQAIREELTERDNLPDYRMPQDIGLSNFNKTWDKPDFTEKCREKFGVK